MVRYNRDEGGLALNIEKKTLQKLFFAAAGCVVLYWLLHETEQFKNIWKTAYSMLSPFILGAALAFILNVPMRTFEKWLQDIKKDGVRRGVAMLLTFFAIGLVLFGVFRLLIPQLVETFHSLVPKLVDFFSGMERNFRAFLEGNPQLLEWVYANTTLESVNWGDLIQKAATVLSNSFTVIASGAFSAVGSVTGALVDIIIGLVFALYCLGRKEVLVRQGKKLLYAFLPERICDETLRILQLTNTTFSSFISGQCLEAVILGCLFAVAMAIFRMPYISLISVLIGVTALVPLVGGFVGCFFGAFFILVNDPVQALIFVVIFLVIQQIEGNLIYPKVVGNSIGLPGMWVLVAVSVGGDLMGVGGMLIMIPVASVIYALLREITNNRLQRRNISPEKLGYPSEMATDQKNDVK